MTTTKPSLLNSTPLVFSPSARSFLWPQASAWPDFPSSSGVYWFKDIQNHILYVGKAKNLHRRLLSYFHYPSSPSDKTTLMLRQVYRVMVKLTATELDALLLEAHFIHTLQPRYNILLKDDKSPLYIAITKELYPRVLSLRKQQFRNSSLEISNFYGPFPSGYQVKILLRDLRHIFPFCNQTPAQKTKLQACFYYHLGLCPGACTGQMSPAAYRRHLRPLLTLLNGQTPKTLALLENRMRSAARLHQFETAAQIRNQIHRLQTLATTATSLDWQPPKLEATPTTDSLFAMLKPYLPNLSSLNRIEGYDISNTQGTLATGSMVVFTDGQKDLSQYRRFKINAPNTPNDVAMIKEVLTRRLRHPEWGIPGLLLVDGGEPQLHAALSVLNPHLPCIALAKREEIIVTAQSQIKLPHDTPALHLLQAIRNEAHRFARSYHIRRRDTINT